MDGKTICAMKEGDQMNGIEIKDNTKEVISEVNSAIAVALEKIGLKAERYAKAYCPVDTGRLRNSITHEINEKNKTVVIGTNVEYGPAIEFGHSKKAPKGYLRPAIFNHMEIYKEIVTDELP